MGADVTASLWTFEAAANLPETLQADTILSIEWPKTLKSFFRGWRMSQILYCELRFPSLLFLIRVAFGVARHVAGVKVSRDTFNDSNLILKETC